MNATKRRTTEELVERIAELCTGGKPRRLMEVCGTHTVSLFRSGLKSLLPPELRLISGPGCPVCVTASGYLDALVALAEQGITLCTYGDMIRVPGTRGSLGEARARGARLLLVYSARDALRHAQAHPEEQVVFVAVGFETTAPASALTVLEAAHVGVENFSMLVGHKLIVPAMLALLAAEEVPLDGFICPGHVSVVIGVEAYLPIVERYAKPCVVAGFEPPSMLQGILRLLELAVAGEAALDSAYPVVRRGGNATARDVIDRVFMPADTRWRALGTIPNSGLALRPAYRRFDAAERFAVSTLEDDEHPEGCRCSEVIQGKVEPVECALFAKRCTPARPVGPCMVSSEGTCAAWHRYGRA